MSQHAKQLCSSLPADRVSSHRGHIITLLMQVTQLSSGWRTAVSLGWQPTEVVKGPSEAGEVPGAQAPVLLCVTVLWQESAHKKAPDRGAEQDTICAGQPQMKRGSWNNLGRKTIGFFNFFGTGMNTSLSQMQSRH